MKSPFVLCPSSPSHLCSVCCKTSPEVTSLPQVPKGHSSRPLTTACAHTPTGAILTVSTGLLIQQPVPTPGFHPPDLLPRNRVCPGDCDICDLGPPPGCPSPQPLLLSPPNAPPEVLGSPGLVLAPPSFVHTACQSPQTFSMSLLLHWEGLSQSQQTATESRVTPCFGGSHSEVPAH